MPLENFFLLRTSFQQGISLVISAKCTNKKTAFLNKENGQFWRQAFASTRGRMKSRACVSLLRSWPYTSGNSSIRLLSL